ncbi:MAG: hypothetical protein UT26_C0009G0029 [Microgenomates group bacterium GW2011_GWC1_39_12]|nr:MAG: hypothetical protein UT26_C0009G0029 [Microgenomates group bacterium GW2011_GWC1_39_12]
MGEYRAGDGPVVSGAAAKQTLGRTTFRRVGRHHLGNRADPTVWTAENRILYGEAKAPAFDRELLFQENPTTVRIYRATNMTDDQIYEILQKQ